MSEYSDYKRTRRSLAAFTLHHYYHYEQYRGAKSGYIAAFMAKLFDLGLQLDVGQPDHKVNTFRKFVPHLLNHYRKTSVEELSEMPRTWRNSDKRRKLQYQLIGIRMTRLRAKEMIEKGDKAIAEREAEKENAKQA